MRRHNCKMEPRDNTLINVFMNRTIKPHVTKFKFVPTTFTALHKVWDSVFVRVKRDQRFISTDVNIAPKVVF